MILNLEHYLFYKKNEQKWIYFGPSYLKLHILEKKNKSKRISLIDKNLLNCSKEKKSLLEWLDSQNIYYNDSIFWWMNSISSKSNLSSHFFQGVLQLSLIKDYLKNKKTEENITIVAENFHLLKFLDDNLTNEHKIRIPKYLLLALFFEKLFLIFRGIINYTKIIIFFITHYFFSKISKSKKEIPSGEIFLFHDLINSSEFKDSPTQSRYFGDFPMWLKKNQKQVISLPWFYKDIKDKTKLYKNLRIKKAFIPEDWLNLSDYFNCIKYSLKSVITINEKIKYKSLNIINLIRHEKLLALSTSKAAIFFRYIPALKKWSNKILSIKFFDHYQNQIYEQTIRYGLKELNIKTISLGHYHSLHSVNYLPYVYSSNEWSSKLKPDYITCSNNICEEKLISQGVPKSRIKIISDLQREAFINFDLKKK